VILSKKGSYLECRKVISFLKVRIIVIVYKSNAYNQMYISQFGGKLNFGAQREMNESCPM